MQQGASIIKGLTGDWPVYPGHPIVLATVIMKVFPNFEAANEPTKHGCCQALADSRIPGSGDHVGAAMRVLQLVARGAAEDAVEYANEYWDRGNAGGHHKNVQAGRAQAQAVEPHFIALALAKTWFTH